MAISTFDELKSSIQSWMLGRSDLASNVEDFITLAETDINHRLRTWQMEKDVTITAASFTDGEASLPTGFKQSRYMHHTGVSGKPLVKVTPDALQELYPNGYAGRPTHYAIRGDGTATPGLEVLVRPYPNVDLVLGYYAEMPALGASQPTNWLLANDPYCYLSGALMYAAKFIRFYEDAAAFGADFQQRLASLEKQDKDARWGNATSRAESRPRI